MSAERAPLDRAGLGYGIAGFLVWGTVPLYFHLLRGVGAMEIVAHRIIWSLLLLTMVIAARRGFADIRKLLSQPKLIGGLALSAALIGVNWLTYIWAVGNDHVLASSLGYFLNPLVNLCLALTVLGERLRKWQAVAIGIAMVGVAVAALGALSEVWISLLLALSFAFYGLARKLLDVGAIEGLYAETLLLAPLSLGYLAWLGDHNRLAFGHSASVNGLLIGSAVVTALPLALFGAAVRVLPYSVMALLQYIAPTMQFLIGWLVLGEPLRPAMLIAFVIIWFALALYSLDLFRVTKSKSLAAVR